MPDLYIIKLGGSVITEKDTNEFKVREQAIERIGKEIKNAMEEKKFGLIVVHGAGPFGHTNVKKYGINAGVFTERHRKGLAKTIKDCNFLDSVVVKKLQEAGIEARGFDPNKLVVQDEKKIIEFNTADVEKAFEEGKVPVLYGQMAKDKKLNASVISGDAIIAFLARKFGARKVLLGTDVAGIYTADPKQNPQAERIELIDENNFAEVLEKVGEASTVDVTQGMKGKLLKLRERLKGTTAVIFDGNKEGEFYRALVGEKTEGTEIRL